MGEIVLDRIDQSKLRESVYAALHAAFTRGAYAPADVLSLRSLAEQLGTSMTPVREAVRRLVAEGALVDTPSRTLQVPPFDTERLTDLMRARIALEPMLTELAVARMTSETEQSLASILQEGTLLGDQPDLEQNYRFHFTLYKESRSPVILPVVEGLWLQYGPYLKLMIARAGPAIGRGNDIHVEILDAVRQRDGRAAAAAVTKDILRSFALVEDGKLHLGEALDPTGS